MNHPACKVAAVAVLAIAAVSGANTRTITRVHPGCVLELEGGWQTHLVGITVADVNDEHARRALGHCREKLAGRLVKFFTWTRDNTAAGIVYGNDGLAFARVFCGAGFEIDIGAELLELGLARVDTAHLPSFCSHYTDLEASARAAHLGIWAEQ